MVVAEKQKMEVLKPIIKKKRRRRKKKRKKRKRGRRVDKSKNSRIKVRIIINKLKDLKKKVEHLF